MIPKGLLAEARNGREDFIGRLDPLERLRVLIGAVHELVDRTNERADTAMDATPKLLLGEEPEPPFHEIEPRAPSRSEVEVEPRIAPEPRLYGFGLVTTGIVQHDMNVEVCRYLPFDLVEELQELGRAVTLVALANDPPCRSFKSCKQRRGAVADVVVSASFGLSRT